MGAIVVHDYLNRKTYEAVDADLAAGVLVIPSTTATSDPSLQGIKVAGDAALNVLGVSLKSAVINANQAGDSSFTESYGYPGTDVSVPSPTLTVARHCNAPLTYTAVAVAYGAKLAAAASGHVRAWVSGDGAAAIVGECSQPGGVGSGGGVAMAYIY